MGGGETARLRKVSVEGQNGGKQCPEYDGLHESASCNTESCAEQRQDLAKEARHLTDLEMSRETRYNNKVLRRAMKAPTVDRMLKEMHHWIDKNIATQMVHVVPPGAIPPTDEDLIQNDLKKAIAKNTVDSALSGFDKEQGAKKGEEQKNTGEKKKNT